MLTLIGYYSSCGFGTGITFGFTADYLVVFVSEMWMFNQGIIILCTRLSGFG